MPIHKSAKKKMRHDAVRFDHNKKLKMGIKTLVKNMRKKPSAEALGKVSSSLDKAVKTNLIHLNKASRMKSRLSKLLGTA